jgi:hypothetical protein
MHNTALNMDVGKYRPYRVREAGKSVHAYDQDVFHPTIPYLCLYYRTHHLILCLGTYTPLLLRLRVNHGFRPLLFHYTRESVAVFIYFQRKLMIFI